jgi:pyrroloquinoline quinone (PQQ) biosynthesis protein C
MRHGDYAWITIAVGVLTYEIVAPPGQLLSEAMDKYRKHHPFAAGAAVIYVAAHLLRVWPTRIDPLHQMAVKLK